MVKTKTNQNGDKLKWQHRNSDSQNGDKPKWWLPKWQHGNRKQAKTQTEKNVPQNTVRNK